MFEATETADSFIFFYNKEWTATGNSQNQRTVHRIGSGN